MAEVMTTDMAAVHSPRPHDSAVQHVTGEARYIDDIPEPPGLLHIALGRSDHAHARIRSMDLSAVRAAPGVVAVFTADDIPGENNVGPVVHDEPLFAEDLVQFHGQCLFAVAATSVRAARRAVGLAQIDYEPLPAILTIAEAREAGSLIEESQRMTRGEASVAIRSAQHRVQGEIEIGGQEHFYLEGQVAMAHPGEGGQIHVHSSTQHPSEVQHLIAVLLDRSSADIAVEVRRMGGGFGGKETQSAMFAAACALATAKTGRPAKLRADRDDDMAMTGKRHDFIARYDAGFDDEGRILGLSLTLESRCGWSTDLSPAINDRAMFHADNCYWLPAVEIVSHRYKTNTVSNTAFRGFGGPQGMLAIERVMDAIAATLNRDPLQVRLANLYSPGQDVTPYGMTVPDNVAGDLMGALVLSSRYEERREAVARFNAGSTVIKRGLALTPVKFGISFTTTHLNQAGALILVYADGSIQINHGGTEMGQGLMVKVAQIVADVFAVPLETVRIMATRTDKVPNTSATAASSGADLNGMAALNAAQTVRDRLVEFASKHFDVDAKAVRFTPDGVCIDGQIVTFGQLCRMAHIGRISLSATGYYATPKIHYDRKSHTGRPFLYFCYGAAVSEVAIDTLTGESRVLAVDILHDAGRSLNPAIDLGQVEGGFVQGMGWLTTEELVFDDRGRLLTHAPSTYKIPTANDRPSMTIRLWEAGDNREGTVHRSKAVGEPPFMLAISVLSALTDAVTAARGGGGLAALDAPATPERILRAIHEPFGEA